MNVFFQGLDEDMWYLAKAKIGVRAVEDMRGVFARDADTKVVLAGCVLNNWTYSAVHAHIWIDNPMVLRHGFLEEVANYVFNTSGKELMVGMVPGDNAEALKLDEHIGFKEKYRIKNGYMHDVDYVIMEATREDLARWLPQENENGWQERARSA